MYKRLCFQSCRKYRSQKDNPSRRCRDLECAVRSGHVYHCFLLHGAQPWATRWIISVHRSGKWADTRDSKRRVEADYWAACCAELRSRVHFLRLFQNPDAQTLVFCFSLPQESAFDCMGLAFCSSLLQAGWGEPELLPACGRQRRGARTAEWIPTPEA